MSLKHALLGVIAARPMNGYSLAQYFADSQAKVWAAPQSQVYDTLNRLADGGLVEARSEIGRNGLESKVYSLTKAGWSEFTGWAGTPQPSAALRDPFALQALYFDAIPSEAAAAVLHAYIGEQRRLVDEYTQHRDLLSEQNTSLLKERLKTRPRSQHDRIAALKAHVFDGQVRQGLARIEWAEEMLKLIDES